MFSSIKDKLTLYSPLLSNNEMKKYNPPEVSNTNNDFLPCIKKNRIETIVANKAYCEKKADKLFGIDIFFDLKLLKESVKFVMKAIKDGSSKSDGGVFSLEILPSCEAPFMQELYRIQNSIATDSILLQDLNFLNRWQSYVLATFTKLTEAVSEATNIPIRPNTPTITEEHEEGMCFLKKDGQYRIYMWWQYIPKIVPSCKGKLYTF